MNPKSFALPLFLAAQRGLPSSATTIVDLSDELSVDQGAIDTSPGSMAVNFAAATYSAIRTAMVLEGGKIVASYVRDGVDGDALFDAYSTTKSWISMLVGILIDEGKLTVTTTLGDIFRNQTVWAAVGDVDFRKAITVSGLCRRIYSYCKITSLSNGNSVAAILRSKNCLPILVDCRFHSLQLCTLL